MTKRKDPDLQGPEALPIWWTTLAWSGTRFDRAALAANCVKTKLWFDARARLGGDPRPLHEVLPNWEYQHAWALLELGEE